MYIGWVISFTWNFCISAFEIFLKALLQRWNMYVSIKSVCNTPWSRVEGGYWTPLVIFSDVPENHLEGHFNQLICHRAAKSLLPMSKAIAIGSCKISTDTATEAAQMIHKGATFCEFRSETQSTPFQPSNVWSTYILWVGFFTLLLHTHV